MNRPNIRPRGKTRIGRLSSGTRLVASLITVLVLAALSFAAGNQFFGSGLTGQINFIASYLGIQNPLSVPVSTTQTVTPANSNGWTASADTCNVPGVTATSSFVSGPATAPLGDGSFRMQVGSNGDSYEITRNPNFSGVRLDQLTTLGYSTFVTAYGSGGQAPYMSLNLDINGNNVVDDRIAFRTDLSGRDVLPRKSSAQHCSRHVANVGCTSRRLVVQQHHRRGRPWDGRKVYRPISGRGA